jgi:hypothetical protein
MTQVGKLSRTVYYVDMGANFTAFTGIAGTARINPLEMNGNLLACRGLRWERGGCG